MTRPRLARLASLLMLGAAVLPAPARAADPVANGSGSQPILLQADQVVYDNDSQTVAAVGHVEVVSQNRIMTADTVSYDQTQDKVTANGHVSLTDEHGNVSFADHVVLTDQMRDGVLSGFGALIGQNGRLAAASAQRIDGRYVVANHTAYSACKICNKPGQRTPIWQVKAERVVYDQAQHRIRFNNATFELFGVPVLYTPYLSEPDPTVRYSSGLLAPDMGNSTTLGNFIRLPYYLALSSTNDMTLAPQFTTHAGELVLGEYRARFNNGGVWLQGSSAYNSKGGLDGGQGAQVYEHLFGAGIYNLNDHWTTGFDAQLTNNAAYMRFYDLSTMERLVNDLFVENNTGRSRFNLSSYYFQVLRTTDLQSMTPYVLPRLDYSVIPTAKVGGGRLRMDLSSAVLGRSKGPDSQRVSAEVNWQRPFIVAGGQIWTFLADAKGDIYHITNNDPINYPTVPAVSHTVSRGTSYAALDWRWPFISHAASGNAYVIEPIAQFIAQPYGGNHTGIPVEDADGFEINDNNIFSFNHIPGHDLVESGPRANLGFRANAIFRSGEAEALLGQTYSLKPDPILVAHGGQNTTSSNIVGRLSIKVPHLSLTDRADYNRNNGTLERHEIYLTGTWGRSALQVSYLQLPPDMQRLKLPIRKEIKTQVDFNFYENWQAFAAIQRDLQAEHYLETEYGLGYEDECLAISLGYRRKYTLDTALGLPPSTSIILRFSLKNGDHSIQPFSLFPQDVFSTGHR